MFWTLDLLFEQGKGKTEHQEQEGSSVYKVIAGDQGVLDLPSSPAMALNTRRMSGMAASQPGGHALLETLDAFRRKHASQNKEIIHRNSDLMR